AHEPPDRAGPGDPDDLFRAAGGARHVGPRGGDARGAHPRRALAGAGDAGRRHGAGHGGCMSGAAVRRWISSYAIFVALGVECLFLALASDAFLTEGNLMNVLRQNALTAILAAGMSLVILTGGIDLSVGSVVGLAGVACAAAMVRGWGIAAGLAIGLLVGLTIGLLNGLVITKLSVPPFSVTLATMRLARGAAYKYTDARTISGLPDAFGDLSHGLVPVAIMQPCSASAGCC